MEGNRQYTERGQQLMLLRNLKLPNDGDLRAGITKAVLRVVDGYGPTCWASVSTLACETQFSERTVYRALSFLEKKGYLKKEPRPGQTSSYSINWETLTPASQSGVECLGPLPDSQGTPASQSGYPCQTVRGPLPASHPIRNRNVIETKLIRKRGARTKFIPPELLEVKTYWLAQELLGSPEEFCDHYIANGWTQGRRSQPLKDWRAAARNWSRRETSFTSSRKTFSQQRLDNTQRAMREFLSGDDPLPQHGGFLTDGRN